MSPEKSMASEQTDPSKAVSKSDFARVVADPAAEVLKYRSFGLAPAVLCCSLVWLFILVLHHERQELHCDRATNSCIAQVDGPLGHRERRLPLDSVTGIRAFVEVSGGSRSPRTKTCKVELETTTGPIKLGVTESYEEDAPCKQTERFAQECRVFLEHSTQPRLDAGYGPLDDWWDMLVWLVIAIISFLLTRESGTVVVSPTFEVVGVSLRNFGWRTYSTFPLASVACCTIDGRRFKPYMALVLANGKHWIFSKGDHFHRLRRRRFKAALNDALERGRKRASRTLT